jgi:hypothetical protein
MDEAQLPGLGPPGDSAPLGPPWEAACRLTRVPGGGGDASLEELLHCWAADDKAWKQQGGGARMRDGKGGVDAGTVEGPWMRVKELFAIQ